MGRFTLRSVGIEVTWNCNQKCSYCYLACDKESNALQKDMDIVLFEDILQKIWDEGIRDVYLIGGEPTLHKRFRELLAIMDRYEWTRKGICTNGIGMDQETTDLITKHFDYASVSVRGTEETTAKITKNPESLRQTMDTLRKFSDARIAIRIGVDLLPEHFRDLPRIVEMLEREGIIFEHIDLHRIIPLGSAGLDAVSSIEHYRGLLRDIDEISRRKGYDIKFEDCLPLCLFDKAVWKYINTCQCGTSKVWIDPYGAVRRCACTSGSIGNIRDETLAAIWRTDIMQDFHSYAWVSDECKKCAKFEDCHGGCPSSRGVAFFDKDIFSDQFKAISS